jgi:hypothetical protein
MLYAFGASDFADSVKRTERLSQRPCLPLETIWGSALARCTLTSCGLR